jgi:2-oxoglutarate dehydrogenase E1 component
MDESKDLPSMEQQRSTSHLSGGNAAYVEDLYEAYLKDPNDVPQQWREYFDRLPKVESTTHTVR